jgi:hypothetical protein
MTRSLGWWWLFLLLLAPACAPAALAVRVPALDRAAATALLLAADEARTRAFATADPGPLRAAFADRAVAALAPQLAALRRRGVRLEERDSARSLVHWAAGGGGGEGVLEVEGEQRIAFADGGARPWSRIVREWWAALSWSGARWLVVGMGDLPPAQWWS